MQSTSLIGQALGGASGTKASAAQDAARIPSKTHKERPFADYVEGATTKVDDAKVAAQENVEKLVSDAGSSGSPDGAQPKSAANQGDSARADMDDAKEVLADEADVLLVQEGVLAGGSKSSLIETRVPANEQGEIALTSADALLVSDTVQPETEAPTSAKEANAEGEKSPAADVQSSLSVSGGYQPVSGAVTGEVTINGLAPEKSAEVESQDAPAASAGGVQEVESEGVETGKVEATKEVERYAGVGDRESAAARVEQPDVATPERQRDTAWAGAAAQEAQPDVAASERQRGTALAGAAARVEQPEVAASERHRGTAGTGAAAQEAQPVVTVSGRQRVAERPMNAEVLNSEKVLDTPRQNRQSLGEASTQSQPAALVNANVSATPSVSQSVFQMQLQNAEVGDVRKFRYAIREGAEQIAAEVSKAASAATGINTAVVASVGNAAIALTQPVASLSEKLSQNATLTSDSLTKNLALSGDLPGLPQLLTEAVFQPGATHRVETPRMIATQLAEAFTAKGERNMDVSLNPEELGRVKMRVSTSDTGIVMTIQTERPETGDLMRRHINELAEEFRRMGFQNISFEFSSGESFGGGAERGERDGGGAAALGGKSNMTTSEPVAGTPTQNLQLGSTGVDMRV